MRGQVSKISDSTQTERRDGWVTTGAGMGGLACSSMAIGAGAIYIPVFHEYGGLRARVAIGTSLGTMMFVVPTAILSHAIHYRANCPSGFGWPLSHWPYLLAQHQGPNSGCDLMME